MMDRNVAVNDVYKYNIVFLIVGIVLIVIK